jgi:hypothetical protein
MLHLRANRKWSMIIRPKYNLKVSNGKTFLLTAKSHGVMEFDLAGQYENEFYSFRKNTASPHKYCFNAYCGQDMILTIFNEGSSDYVEIKGERFRFGGLSRNKIEECNFAFKRHIPLIGGVFKSEYPEEFEKEGLVLSSFCIITSSNKI